MGVRDSFVLMDGKMRVLAELITLFLIANLATVWYVLDGVVLYSGILPAAGMIGIFWYLIWLGDLSVLEEELHYYKDGVVILASMVATAGFIGVTVLTGSYGQEAEYCMAYNACIDHAFTVSSGLAALFVTVALFGITLHYIPRLVFPQMYETIRETAFFAAWSTEEDEVSQMNEMGMKRIGETGLDDVSFDEIVEYEQLNRYHKFVLPVFAGLAIVNAVIWEMGPNNLTAPYHLHLVVVAVVFLHIIYITGPRMYAMYADDVMHRLRRVTYGSAVTDGVLIGILIGVMLIHPDIPHTGELSRNAQTLLVILLAIPTAAAMPAILHYVFRGENESSSTGATF